MTKRVAFIFARGGSKGLKDKNILDFFGKPLIAHTIIQAQDTALFDKIIVSTDSPIIMEVALSYGADVPFRRPDFLATDDSPEWLSWQHAVNYHIEHFGEFDTFISLPATSPLRRQCDIRRAISLYESTDSDVTTCITESYRNPYFNMLEQKRDGFLNRVIPTQCFRRQDAPPTYDMTTIIFVSGPFFIINSSSIFEGKINGVIVDKRTSIDIDTKEDLELARISYEAD
jgi:N-acylneuraminate cytidylyltransferase